MQPLDHSLLVSLAAFGCVDRVGRRTLRKVAKLYGSQSWNSRDLWVPTERIIQFLSLTTKQIESIQKTNSEQIIDAMESSLARDGVRLIGTESDEYPPFLRESDDPPPVLFVKGSQMIWEEGALPVAIVGTRDVTPYGKLVTEKLTTELSDLGAVIVSGLMYGVDTTAHEAAIRAGGTTIAVLGYGFDHCYPSEHQHVFDSLLSNGATFISEYPPWRKARKGNFPARNSIVAGMSAAVVVTEAAARSGSLITAQFALDEGRVVCAVPGPITNPYCDGTKWLINEGATLVSSGEEVLQQIYQPILNGEAKRSHHETTVVFKQKNADLSLLSELARHILKVIHDSPADIDALQVCTGASQSALLVELTTLELQRAVSKDGTVWKATGIT